LGIQADAGDTTWGYSEDDPDTGSQHQVKILLQSAQIEYGGVKQSSNQQIDVAIVLVFDRN